MATEALAISDIDTYYGDSHVLHGVSFSLQPGRLLGLLGRNGAGKTTSMNVAMGMLAPRSGSVTVDGVDMTGRPPEALSARGVALVPQGRRVFPKLTVKENLTVARQKGRWSLETVFELFPRLKERAEQYAGSLSGGEQQMLAIGRALMGNPRVLLMDEPSEGLAPIIVAEVGRTIARLKAEGQSIVLVEQNVKLALELADEVAILNTGRVIFAGPASQVGQSLITQHLGVF